MKLEEIKEKNKNSVSKLPIHFDFLSKGLACHALCLLEYSGILDMMLRGLAIKEESLYFYRNPSLIRAAFSSLVTASVVSVDSGEYYLTPLGKVLGEHIGCFFLPLVGYRRLLANQYHLLNDPSDWEDTDVDFSSIATASVDFGLHELDPLILRIFQQFKPKGTLCDLGCGTGEKLIEICEKLNIKGLGIEKNPFVVKANEATTKNYSFVEIIQGDITDLNEVREDVTAAMTNMVFHDIAPNRSCVQFLQSLRQYFPKLQYLLIADMVAMSEDYPSSMPGFDYVHGLQGITPRNYQETMQVFADAGYSVVNETAVPNMPNTFIWVVSPSI